MGLMLLVAAGFARLGVWQLGRLDSRRAANRTIVAARAAPPVRLDQSARGLDSLAGHRVVDTGPYALVRHPIYTGLIAGAVALALLQAKPWPILGAALFALGFTLKARVEERFLEREIGGYEAYRRRVSMIVPLPKLF